jgi:hypothetical protein
MLHQQNQHQTQHQQQYNQQHEMRHASLCDLPMRTPPPFDSRGMHQRALCRFELANAEMVAVYCAWTTCPFVAVAVEVSASTHYARTVRSTCEGAGGQRVSRCCQGGTEGWPRGNSTRTSCTCQYCDGKWWVGGRVGVHVGERVYRCVYMRSAGWYVGVWWVGVCAGGRAGGGGGGPGAGGRAYDSHHTTKTEARTSVTCVYQSHASDVRSAASSTCTHTCGKTARAASLTAQVLLSGL